ncbi:MAG: substrate-binding domain-containing protein [Phycisphaerae bacterium]
MAVTIQQIAEQTGFSRETVRRVIKGDGHRHSEQTREAIDRAIAALGYRPNAVARGLGRGRFDAVSLLLPPGGQAHVPPGLLRGITEGVAARKWRLQVDQVQDASLEGPGGVSRLLTELSADGFLVDRLDEVPAPFLDPIRAAAAPALLLNTRRPSNCLYPDDFKAATDVGGLLAGRGHRRWCYVGPSDAGHYSVRDRLGGLAAAADAAGARLVCLESDDSIIGDMQDGHGAAAVIERLGTLLRRGRDDRPTAVVCYGQPHLITVMLALAGLGLQAPRDVSLMAFGNYAVAFGGRQVTTMTIRQRAFGQRAVAKLADWIERNSLEPCEEPAEAFELELEPGSTLGPCPVS